LFFNSQISKTATKLTRGEALCAVLLYKPTEENIKKAKEVTDPTPFDVCYTVQHGGQLHPFVMGKDVIETFQHIYKTYKDNDTPDTASGQHLEATKEEECNK
jgi:hypothetical protein